MQEVPIRTYGIPVSSGVARPKFKRRQILFPLPSLPSPFLPQSSPLFFPPSTSLSPPLSLPSLEVGPLNPAKMSGGVL